MTDGAAEIAVAVDLLAAAIAKVRPHLDRSQHRNQRMRILWAAVKASRRLAVHDVVLEEFTALARHCGLIRDLGQHGDGDIAHVLSWALRGMDPFGV
jgi:hypothetical protein